MHTLDRPLSLAVAALWLALVGACGDQIQTVGYEPIDGASVDGASDATPAADLGPATDASVQQLLTFVQSHGDDQVSCQGTNHCSIVLSFSEVRTLNLLYTEDGVPVDFVKVKFALDNDDNAMGHLSTLSTTTQGGGIASVEVKANQPQVGQFAVKAWVAHEGIAPLYFDVLVVPKGQVPLTVIGTYDGLRPVTTYKVRLFPQDALGAPTCGDLEHLYENVTASWQSPATNKGQSVKKHDFDLIAPGESQLYTVLAFAEDTVHDTVLAWGCDDVTANVSHEMPTTVELPMLDVPPKYAGSYDVVTYFDFVSVLPPPADEAVYLVLDFFKSPVGGLLSLACTVGQGNLASLCDLIFQDPANPSVDDLKIPYGTLIVDILDALVSGLAQGTVFGDILNSGSDIADMLTGFEVHGTIVFKSEPDADGFWAEGEGVDTWDYATVKWSLNANCNPLTDEGCGKMNLSFASIQPDDPVIEGFFGGHVKNFTDLTIDLHPLNVQYGALINALVEKVFLPLVLGDGSDGNPAVDSYEDALYVLIGGGTDCLNPAWQMENDLTCCEKFAEQVAGGGGSLNTVAVLENTCDALIEAGAFFLKLQIGSLTADTGEGFVIGTAEPCLLVDSDQDMVIDAMGGKSDPCLWEVQLGIGQVDATIDAIFWGARAN